ncbi:hypothetical protein GCM10011378_01620 [Hymenobacter glacieicola]|uniref:Uncharacterized protein n=1 Tax=Hymenobacter glacieicola TaxID=1562124 RepID=A0ABQ1WFB9_9BACT|nr:hypothetical protein GCM10011378_01620 [Hymenobacter glacieicola]
MAGASVGHRGIRPRKEGGYLAAEKASNSNNTRYSSAFAFAGKPEQLPKHGNPTAW